jgi:hypothetical protein
MMDDGRTDCGIIALRYTTLGEEGTHLGERVEPCHRIAAMSMAQAVVRPGDIVQIDGRPETWRLFCPPGRRDQTEGVHHHSGDVRLPVEGTGVREQLQWGRQTGQRKRDGRRSRVHVRSLYSGSGQTPGWPVSFSICVTTASSSRTSLG